MKLAGAAGFLVLAGCGNNSSETTSTSSIAGSGACILSPNIAADSHFIDGQLDLVDLTEGTTDPNVLNGIPLILQLQIVSYTKNGCSLLSGAHVDVWHCDAAGVFSGEASENTASQNFLRGYQITDANGLVGFKTIYPGWYAGRTVHIGVMVRTYDSTNALSSTSTTELYFDDSLTDTIFAQAPYNARGTRDTRNSQDKLYNNATQLILTKDATGNGYSGSIIVGVQIS